jgi:hypothetical protein
VALTTIATEKEQFGLINGTEFPAFTDITHVKDPFFRNILLAESGFEQLRRY